MHVDGININGAAAKRLIRSAEHMRTANHLVLAAAITLAVVFPQEARAGFVSG